MTTPTPGRQPPAAAVSEPVAEMSQ
jgi:hypothetical protein